MSATPTTGESEADNSSSMNNISSLLAERGTTTGSGGVLDEEFDESSIEALNWSEADEEELQLEVLRVKNKSPVVKKIVEIEGEIAAASASLVLGESTTTTSNEESDVPPTVRMLSSSLLESINSSISTKQEVIENWASGVKQATDRGEMEIQDDEEKITLDNKDETEIDEGIRRRKKVEIVDDDKKSEVMTASVLSSQPTEVDPLSNAPVLDDGPIWNKGQKKSYRFTENRRINQKLTVCLVFTIVLALGLGLGNLVAFNECETEYKVTQEGRADLKPNKDSIPPTTLESAVVSSPSQTEEKQTVDNIPPPPTVVKPPTPEIHVKKPDIEVDREQYTMQMQTLSKIVQTLDNLQRKIDNFENHTRHLGGVVMMNDPNEVEKKSDDIENEDPWSKVMGPPPSLADKDSLLEETVHPLPNDNDYIPYTPEDADDEEAFILELIAGIEETVGYLRQKEAIKQWERLERMQNEGKLFKSKLFQDGGREKSEQELRSSRTIQASLTIFKKAHDLFLQTERDELREKKILGLAEERQPKDYSVEEKAQIKAKYDTFMLNYPFKAEVEVEAERLKFVKMDDPDTSGFSDPSSDSLDDDIESFFKKYGQPDMKEMDEDDILLDFGSWMTPTQEPEETWDDSVQEKSEVIYSTPIPEVSTQDNTPEHENKLKTKKRSIKRSHKKQSSSVEYPEKADEEESYRDRIEAKLRRKAEKSKEKKKKHSNREDNSKWDDNDGSGSGKKKERKQKYDRNQKSPPPNRHFTDKGYDLSTHWEMDDDSDDNKRKKYSHYHSHSKSEDNPPQGDYDDMDTTRNWLLERTRLRQEIRSDTKTKTTSGSSSNGKNNWQMQRDRVRQNVRSKSERNKSFGSN